MTSNRVSNLPIIGGVIASGILLLLVSIGGIYATLKQHQVLLFFYMVILFCLFIVQFSVACACLSVSKETQEKIANEGWSSLNFQLKESVQQNYVCCGFKRDRTDLGLSNQTDPMAHPSCNAIDGCNSCTLTEGKTECCSDSKDPKLCPCPSCIIQVETQISQAFRVTGAVSLFFSFTEVR